MSAGLPLQVRREFNWPACRGGLRNQPPDAGEQFLEVVVVLANCSAPCSVNAQGGDRRPPRPLADTI